MKNTDPRKLDPATYTSLEITIAAARRGLTLTQIGYALNAHMALVVLKENIESFPEGTENQNAMACVASIGTAIIEAQTFVAALYGRGLVAGPVHSTARSMMERLTFSLYSRLSLDGEPLPEHAHK